MLSVNMQIRVTAEEHERYKKAAASKKMSLSKLVRQHMNKNIEGGDDEFYSLDEDLEIEEAERLEKEEKDRAERRKRFDAFMTKAENILEEIDEESTAKELL